MTAKVKSLNAKYPDKCYTPACGSDGRCTYTEIALPNSMPTTKCMKAQCKMNSKGVWSWNYLPTAVNESCKSDACSFRECRNDADETLFPDGCYFEDICMNKTTECETYTCNISTGKAVCYETKAHFEDRQCSREVCKDGKKVWELKDLTTACKEVTKGDKCKIPYCQEDGTCNYTDKMPVNPDLCMNYTCDPNTGDFNVTVKCDDGLYCTENICVERLNFENPDLSFGECHFDDIRCSDEIDMDAYPCFVAQCREDPDNADNDKKYKCVRKLLRNAYIDVCGNCIVEKVPDFTPASGSETPASSSSSSSHFEPSVSEIVEIMVSNDESSSVDLLECTGAPARPLLTEGLAAASIALIVIAAVVIGAAITASGVLGTKALIDRAKMADNQSAHTNPLYQTNDTEMSNPAFEP